MSTQISEPQKTSFGVWILRSFFALSMVIVFSVIAVIIFHITGPEPPAPFHVKSYYGKVMVFSAYSQEWVRPEKDQELGRWDIIRTAPDSELQLTVGDAISVRVKEDSILEVRPNSFFDRKPTRRLHLIQGSMIAAVEESKRGYRLKLSVQGESKNIKKGKTALVITVPRFIATLKQGYLLLKADPDANKVWLGLLRGQGTVQKSFFSKSYQMKGLQKIDLANSAAKLGKPEEITKEDWSSMKEAYELFSGATTEEAEETSLAASNGNFFDYVFDHGTFFTPKTGYADRKLINIEETGEQYLEIEYDVFPRGSFVGMYFKPRDLDLSKYSAIRFQARQKPLKGHPANTKIELKSSGMMARVFALKNLKKNWETYEFPLNIRNSKLLHELTFVFAHDRVGDDKQGFVQMKDFELIPKK